MLDNSNILVDCNCIGFYLVVEDMKGVIGWYAYAFSQVGMLKHFFAVVNGGYRHNTGLGGQGLIETNICC